jgi:hypothetical protein
MRGHKFICLVDPTYWLEGDIPTVELCEQIVWSDDAYMAVLTVAHENIHDNFVTIKTDSGDDVEFVRTIDGRLYYVSDWRSKADLIREFEQTD